MCIAYVYGMATRNPYLRAQRTAQTAPAAAPAQAARDAAAWRRAMEAAPHDPRSLALRQATGFAVDRRNYTNRERVAASHAMDSNGQAQNALSFVAETGFPGFPTLSLLAQLPEFRAMHERLADECVRAWGEVVSTGDTPPEKIAELTNFLKDIDLKSTIRLLVIQDQSFGRAHPLFKFKNDENVRGLPLLPKRFSVPKGSFQGIRPVEAYWVTPNNYNSTDPSQADFYKPKSWWMLGQEAHASRLTTINSRPVPDMLKPTYSFAGVSMTQLAMPYVDNWLRTRQSVSDTVKQFSISGVRTDLAQALQPGGGADLAYRAELINRYRDNRNLMFLDMATEEFFQVNTPLSGLAELQAQSQEQMSAVSHLPLVVLLGITPTGLNASSDGERAVHEDYVAGYQNNVLQTTMVDTLRYAQLSLYGEVDPGVDWKWHKLRQSTDVEQADVDAKNADTDSKYVEIGAVSPLQVSRKLNADPDSRYTGLLEEGEADINEIPDEDVAGITEHIMGMGANGDNPPSAGQARPAASGPVTERPDGGGVQPRPDQGNGPDGGELSPLGGSGIPASPGEQRRRGPPTGPNGG